VRCSHGVVAFGVFCLVCQTVLTPKDDRDHEPVERNLPTMVDLGPLIGDVTIQLTGVGATMAVGSISPSTTVALTGVSAIASTA
jgi:hypothetical protein